MRIVIDYDARGELKVDVSCCTKDQRHFGKFIRALAAIRDHVAREEAILHREQASETKLGELKAVA